MKSIPGFIASYLWDVKTDDLVPQKHADFIIERVLEYGDEKSLIWLKKKFSREKIISILTKSKRISPKTGNFYAIYYNLPKEQLLCIQQPFTQKQNRF